MTEPPKGPKSFVVSKTIPTGGLPDKAAKPKETPAEASAEATPDAPAPSEAPKPTGGVAKRVMSFSVGGKPKPKP